MRGLHCALWESCAGNGESGGHKSVYVARVRAKRDSRDRRRQLGHCRTFRRAQNEDKV